MILRIRSAPSCASRSISRAARARLRSRIGARANEARRRPARDERNAVIRHGGRAAGHQAPNVAAALDEDHLESANASPCIARESGLSRVGRYVMSGRRRSRLVTASNDVSTAAPRPRIRRAASFSIAIWPDLSTIKTPSCKAASNASSLSRSRCAASDDSCADAGEDETLVGSAQLVGLFARLPCCRSVVVAARHCAGSLPIGTPNVPRVRGTSVDSSDLQRSMLEPTGDPVESPLRTVERET
jgi:hypothetical protein